MADPGNYGGHVPEWDSPAIGAAAPTKSNSVPDPAGPFRALWVGGAGDVKITMINGDVVSVVGVLAGSLIPFATTQVWVTGTSATSILGLK